MMISVWKIRMYFQATKSSRLKVGFLRFAKKGRLNYSQCRTSFYFNFSVNNLINISISSSTICQTISKSIPKYS